MAKEFKPMLAGKMKDDGDYDKITFPVITTPKLDGIRVLMKDGQLWTRSLKKPLPNIAIQDHAVHMFPDGIDGEIITYHDQARTQMKKLNQIASDVMSSDGSPYWRFHAFDDFTIPSLPYQERLVSLYEKVQGIERIEFVPPVRVQNKEELLALHAENVGAGWEGTMYRYPLGAYKYGRSTLREGGLVKIKDFLDDEATVIGFEELFRNENESKTNALGRSERSSHKAGMVAADTLGSLVCRWNKGPDFNVGTGFTMAERDEIWQNRDDYAGLKATIKYQTILKDKPEFPVFVAFRPEGT